MIKRILGVIAIIVAIIIGFYVGLYICFFKSAIEIINAIITAVSNGTGLVAKDVFWSFFKLFVGTTFFEILALFTGAGGMMVIADE